MDGRFGALFLLALLAQVRELVASYELADGRSDEGTSEAERREPCKRGSAHHGEPDGVGAGGHRPEGTHQ